ncbi:hypothetical protein [Streptomyces kronopolitis]|uniref:hypothetical protein n=1 Tax=Streptomyces kronopolitis TaxID=1612435 RepID=UPI003D99C3DA
MRLRQAHAILEAAAAIEALGLGFETWPYDHDHPNAIAGDEDFLVGYAEICPAATPGWNVRSYHLALRPGPGSFDVNVQLNFEFGSCAVPLLDETIQVWRHAEGSEPFDTGGAGHKIAHLVAGAVAKHEKPYLDTEK